MAHHISAEQTRDLAGMLAVKITTILIPNLHCPSCVSAIHSALDCLDPKPYSVSHSIVSHSITVRHNAALALSALCKALERAGFETYDAFEDTSSSSALHESQLQERFGIDWVERFSNAIEGWRSKKSTAQIASDTTLQIHLNHCKLCDAEVRETSDLLPTSRTSLQTERTSCLNSENIIKEHLSVDGNVPTENQLTVVIDSPELYRASFVVEGMTCSSCVGAISRVLKQKPWIKSTDVSLLTNSASVTFYGTQHVQEIIALIEDIGYGAVLDEIVQVPRKVNSPDFSNFWRATFAIHGMTCSSCVGAISKSLQKHDWASKVAVNLISNSATVEFSGKENLALLEAAIAEVGFEANLNSLEEVNQENNRNAKRIIEVRIDGMYCDHCPSKALDALDRHFGKQIEIEKPLTRSDVVLRISYYPEVPNFTIRQIMATLVAADTSFRPSIYHPPTLEERSRKMQTRERKHVIYRLCLSLLAAIPTFVIGIVMMSLLPTTNPLRSFWMQPSWVGQVSRGNWALFIIATPVYFCSADAFHRPALRELRGLWRSGNSTPIFQRFYRFGSMNMLISLGTTVAYISSIAQLAISATQSASLSGVASSYFDSVVFLTFFLLSGRFLEAYSKAKTGDAVNLLRELRPHEAIVVIPDSGNHSEHRNDAKTTQHVSVDLLEVGDVVKVVHGASPPVDGVIIGDGTRFDESSLTGESKLVEKSEGENVYSGTVNKGSPVFVRISNKSGTSLLDQIIKSVREGQTKRAPIESMADAITSYFVPLVVFVALLTWIIWLTLGITGKLSEDYKGMTTGGWPFWSLEFAIAVFVVACPCGIGLASPTALFVGGGLAANFGILAKGGGEAFQNASSLDIIVFDKTGTLTLGGEPKITDHEFISSEGFEDEQALLGLIKNLEQNSCHPIARAMVSFCDGRSIITSEAEQIREIPGRGMKGAFNLNNDRGKLGEVILGNESLMAEHGINLSNKISQQLHTWKSQGKSVALLAICKDPENPTENGIAKSSSKSWNLSAIFASSDPLRPDAAATIRAIQQKGIQVWMISGDNAITARAVGKLVGIPADQVIAGVLPDQKAKKIQDLQLKLENDCKTGSWFGRSATGTSDRALVAMVGDGINDSPALTTADVGIAIGSGSDVAISSADFVLLTPNLKSLLTLIELSRAVIRRVKFNFFWALVYNLAALPIAAGALYAVRSNGSHIRLDPVWASLAMALSSVSVVCSSLLLKSKLPFVGFRR